jgi:hypothetical protein
LNVRYLLPGVLLAAGIATAATPAADTSARFDIAITADDLPAHGPLPPGLRWDGIAQSYVDTLRAHGVPSAWGFVNAKYVDEDPASEAALDVNHTYSHLGLSQAPSLEAWLTDVRRGEPVLEKHMAGADWHVLRYPFLDAGGDKARHDGARAWLDARGYRVADVSFGVDDWAYTDTYARCLAQHDTAAIAAMKTEYFHRLDQQIVRTRALSQRVYGRMIPLVMLTHMGAWSAATLPEVLRRLDAAGARYVTLEQAQADPAYTVPGPRSGNGSLIERHAQEAGIGLAGLPPADPVGKLDTLCR